MNKTKNPDDESLVGIPDMMDNNALKNVLQFFLL